MSKTKAKKNEAKTENKFKIAIVLITLVFGNIFYALNINNIWNSVHYIRNIINATTLLLILIIVSGAFIFKNKFRNALSIVASIILILTMTFNLLVMNDVVKLRQRETLDNFANVEFSSLLMWATGNNIDLNVTYENSDNIAEGFVIKQDIAPGTLLSQVTSLDVIISNGPNLDKEVLIVSMVGWDIDEVLEFIEENHLSNVIIDYEINEDIERNIVISQSDRGTLRRNSSLTIVLSLGPRAGLVPIEIDDLVEMSEFDATLYLRRHGISYDLRREYSDTVPRDHVLAQDKEPGTTVDPNGDKVILTISRGSQITIPSFNNVEDVIKWATENNLRIRYDEIYSSTIEAGRFIRINHETGSKISEGDRITITISKGPLIFPGFTNLSSFRSWAHNNDIRFTENRDYHNTVPRGNIISFNVPNGARIDVEGNQTITVNISNGVPITVPNFVGKTRAAITTECRNIGLNCSFQHATAFSSTPRDTATAQNVRAGNRVIAGAWINITLSRGPAQSFNVFIQTTWFGTTADATITTLRRELTAQAPGVTFVFNRVSNNSVPAGFIDPNSPVKAGSNTFVQGRTYTINVVR